MPPQNTPSPITPPTAQPSYGERPRRSRGPLFWIVIALLAMIVIFAVARIAPRILFSKNDDRNSAVPHAVIGDIREATPILSYQPSCTSACSAGCLSGTEVQALESFNGTLYAGFSNWEETLACVFPQTSAQINVLASENGEWKRGPDLPASPKCKAGQASWEQVNDLHAAEFGASGSAAKYLFASALVNEDGGCPGLQASVFYLNPDETVWLNTGLDTRLAGLYGGTQTEIRYVHTFSDGTSDCPADRPCLFAFVGPRDGKARVGPSVWRGVYDPANPSCELICWDQKPEIDLSGTTAPIATRIVSVGNDKDTLYFGSSPAEVGKCPDESSFRCHRTVIMERTAPGTWEPLWLGTPIEKGGPAELRGIASWEYADGSSSLWFITANDGHVRRIDTASDGSRGEVVDEIALSEAFLPEACGGKLLYPYQLYVYQKGPSDTDPELLVASQSCGNSPRESFGRIFYRSIAKDSTWGVVNMPSFTNTGTNRSNEASIRWIHKSPFNSDNIFFGTTDMNNTPDSLTARIYLLKGEF